MQSQSQDRATIAKALLDSFAAVKGVIAQTPPEKAFEQPGEKWSMVQQFQHLILSNAPVASALKKPFVRLASFGAPADPTMDYAGLKSKYYEVLGKGVKAPPPFVPEKLEKPDFERLFDDWEKINQKFQGRLQDWTEADLDKFAVPHPVLGLLSIRQMLLFTVLHNLHHLKQIEQLKS